MKNKNILITGGAGFIGSHLVDKLIENKNSIFIVDSLISSTLEYINPHINSGKCKFFQIDLRKEGLFDNLKIENNIDYIFHMAADPNVQKSVKHPIESFNHNVKGTINSLELARQLKVKGYIFASSGGTLYGDVEKFPITEFELLQPISPYGASKASGEMYVSAYANAYEFKAVSCRYANIFGERSNHGVSFDFYNKLKENPYELIILGDGMQRKSYLHVSDCVEATITLGDNLTKQKPWFDYYNIGSKDWIITKKIARIIEKEMNLKDVKHTFTGGKKGWVGDVHKMLLSIEKIEKSVGWLPKLTIKEGISRYINWMQNKY
ncbi:MAG: NAD-dependent epimerase/dehydratase family protein [Promethearchaeota archaeon]